MHFTLLLVLAVGGYLAWRWLQRQPAAMRRNAGIKIALGGLGVLALLGVLTGRLNPGTLLLTAGAAIPLLMRLLDFKQLFDRFTRGRPGATTGGRQSSVTTDFLEMTLDHDTGEMSGRVTRGQFGGRSLGDLELEDLQTLLAECAKDPQSARLLEAYIDRVHGGQWRAGGGGGGVPDASMTPAQAREILGVGPGADRDEVIAAHRSLMQKLHPDRGGSTFLAAQVNQAKEVLLAHT